MRNLDGSMLITILAHCIPYLIVQVAAQLIMKEKPSCSAAILENPSSYPPPLQAVRRQAGSSPAGSIPIPPKILVKMYKLVGKIP